MKICLASLAPFVGGAEIAAERLALGLVAAGHEVSLILGKDGAVRERLQAAGLTTHVARLEFTDKWRFWRHQRATADLVTLLARESPDVLHANDLPTHQTVANAGRRLKIPRICHHRFPFGGAAIDWFNKFGAQRHLFVSRALMNEMCEQSPNLAASPRAVVHDGLPLPPNPSQSARRAARAALGLPAERTIVTFAGQIILRKGVAELILAWSQLSAEERQAAQLVIIGEDLEGHGQYRRQMEQLADEQKVPARFVGFEKDVGPWLTASDVAVVPSHVEPLGNATLEAMSYGLPVIGSDVGGIPEMIVQGETGLLVAPRDPRALSAALAQLLGDEAARLALGAAARKRCERHFSLEAHAAAVVQEYAQAANTEAVPA